MPFPTETPVPVDPKKDLVTGDLRLLGYKWVAISFVVAMPIVIAFHKPANFLREYRDMMLMVMPWPLLTLAALYFFRRRYLAGLSLRGKAHIGVVKKVRRSKAFRMRDAGTQTAQVAVTIDGQLRLVRVDAGWGRLKADSKVELLVDPKRWRKPLFIRAL
ncbi:MAG: hypothetical protein M3041_00640 [Acidobacteriota bacterium]|nr:hypothetical protein [Acidobacteriota bacterium]